jgi:hypothetical protein
MKRFKVKLHGKNFLLNYDGELKKFGFFATKFVKAENPQEAEKMDIKKAREIGASGYLEKPHEKRDLAKMVRKVLDGK